MSINTLENWPSWVVFSLKGIKVTSDKPHTTFLNFSLFLCGIFSLTSLLNTHATFSFQSMLLIDCLLFNLIVIILINGLALRWVYKNSSFKELNKFRLPLQKKIIRFLLLLSPSVFFAIHLYLM